MDLSLNYLPQLAKRKDFRIGCIGAGFIMRDCHLLAYRNAGFNPVAIASRNPANAEACARLHNIPRVHKTIDEVLEEFLDEQEPRLALATYTKYETIIDLLKSYMEQYWPGHDGEYDRVTRAGGTYGGTYGPEDIAGAFGMFLDYFMPHKVLCGGGTEKAAPVVIRKLAKWLVAKGYDPDAGDAVE